MILQMISRPAEKPESAMREMLRPDAVQAKPVRFDQAQMMPDARLVTVRTTPRSP
jgi:hypothetical protein